MSEIIKFNNDNTFQKLRAHYLDPDNHPLSTQESEQLERALFLYNHRMKASYSKDQAQRLLMRKFGISVATFYRDYQLMKSLFGNVDETEFEMERVFIREKYFQLFQKLERQGKFEKAGRMLEKYEATFPKVDANQIDVEKLKSNVYNITVPREVHKVIKEQVKTDGVFDFNDVNTQDIPYEMVKEQDDEEGLS